MMNPEISLFSNLSTDRPGTAPELIHLCPAGTFTGVDGRGPFKLDDPAGVIAASLAAGKLPIDENHAIDLAGKDGRPSPARGWIVGIEGRPDGLWARVEWTGEGRKLIADRAYRGISPVIMGDKKSGKVLKILRASLTNDPNLNLTTLHQRSSAMTLLPKLLNALGLDNQAADDQALTEAAAAAKAKRERAGDLDKLNKALGLSATTIDELISQIEGRDPKDEDKTSLQSRFVALQAQFTELVSSQSRTASERVVDDAIRAGKVLPPQREFWIENHLRDPKQTEVTMGGLLSLHAGGSRNLPARTDGIILDADESEVCALMNVDAKAFAESKKSYGLTAL